MDEKFIFIVQINVSYFLLFNLSNVILMDKDYLSVNTNFPKLDYIINWTEMAKNNKIDKCIVQCVLHPFKTVIRL